MLESLYNHYKEGSPRLFPEIQSWLNFLDIRLNKSKERYLKVDHLINGVQQKMIHALNLVDIPYLVKKSTDDFYIYINYFNEIKEQVEGLYSLNSSSYVTKNQYVKKINHACTEITVPLFDCNYLSIWPMGKDYPYWRDTITPLYLNYHDSIMLNYDIKFDKIIFKYDEPNIAVFFLDIPSLCMKYFKWYLHTNYKDIYTFITHEVWCNLLKQLQHIWVMRQHELAILNVSGIDISGEVNFNNKDQVKVGGRYVSVMDKLSNFYKEVSEGKVLMETVFSSKLFNYNDNKTFRDLVNYTLTRIDIPSFTQYLWVKILRDYPLLKYLCQVYLLNSNSIKFNAMRNSFNIYWSKVISKTPWDYIKTPYVREWFKNKIKIFDAMTE